MDRNRHMTGGGCLKQMMSRDRQMSGRVSQAHDEPESPDGEMGEPYLRCMMSRNRQMSGRIKIYDEPESPNCGGGVFKT